MKYRYFFMLLIVASLSHSVHAMEYNKTWNHLTSLVGMQSTSKFEQIRSQKLQTAIKKEIPPPPSRKGLLGEIRYIYWYERNKNFWDEIIRFEL